VCKGVTGAAVRLTTRLTIASRWQRIQTRHPALAQLGA
jgi:hypothetical protein